MIYRFVCDDCKSEKEIELPLGEVHNTKVLCDSCNKEMHQKWSNNVVIPDHMKAGEDSEATEWIFDRLENSRFSGKDQILF